VTSKEDGQTAWKQVDRGLGSPTPFDFAQGRLLENREGRAAALRFPARKAMLPQSSTL
jgi:hypothetical protein